MSKQPDHCKGCSHFHNAGHKKGSNLAKYNAWCCAKGDFAVKSVGHCKQHNLKSIKEEK